MSFGHLLKKVLNFNKTFLYHKKHIRFYSIPKAKQQPTEFALHHFDQFYAPVFKNWSSIRLGLLCPHYYCAVTNVFSKKLIPSEVFCEMDVFNLRDMYCLNLADVPGSNQTSSNVKKEEDVSSTMDDLEDNPQGVAVFEEEYVPATRFKNREFDIEEEYSEFYNIDINYKAQLVRHGAIHYPEHWEIYFCQRGKFKKFQSPKVDVSNLLNYYLMDGASLLPVLALDIKKGEEVGDLCASPGGKSLAILFGMQFGKLVVNDFSLTRLNKLKSVLDLYLPGTEEWSKKILVSNLNIANWNCFELFDKILLDVPCTNDRLSVTRDNNNIFQQKRFNERMQIPKLQTAMLCAGLKALKPGGSLVYSTCSMSPIQNDGVVHMALSRLSTECDAEFIVGDLTDAFYPLRNIFQFSDTCRYGQLVIPFLPLNYGPMYIAKITRNK